MSAAVTLTAAMAHRVNNPLQAAMLLLYRLKQEGGQGDTGAELLAVLEVEINRVASVSSELLRNTRLATYEELEGAPVKKSAVRSDSAERLEA